MAEAALHLWTPPEEFDEYRILKPIGSGSGGRVYLAHDTLLDRLVAIKFIPARDADALSRFLVEARACARIQHPNVASLYRVGDADGCAYLVSEFVKGKTLNELSPPIEWRRALELALGLARGLAAAHRRGVLHRDLKPANAVLAEDGDAKLVDFGLARLVRAGSGEALPLPAAQIAAGTLVGTPYFMPPEAWRGEELTPPSDLWSLGAVIYSLCAPAGLNRDVPPTELGDALQRREPRPLGLAAERIDVRFAAVVDRCLRRDPARRFASADELVDALEQLRATADHDPVPGGNPYRGLQPFAPEHKALFFGRRRDGRALIDKLWGEPFVLVVGESGVGKSSLCLAGVLPAIEGGALGKGRTYKTIRLVPGRAPLQRLAGVLAPLLGEEEDAVVARLHHDPAQLARALRKRLGTAGGLVIFVDQLEELVTLSGAGQRPFSIALAELAAGLDGVRVLATARGDFLTRLAELPALGELVPKAVHLLRGLTPDEAREAILGPARAKGVRFESADLVGALVVSGATHGALPLLQFTLAELWDARDPETGLITAAALQRIGGVSGALARHADACLHRLLPEDRPVARRILLALVTADGTRARKTEAELTGGDPRAKAVLETLVVARLVVAGDDSTHEIAHEALITGWGTLAGWLAEESEGRALRNRLEASAVEWARAGRVTEALWGAARLAQVANVDPATLPEQHAAFLRASRQAARRSTFVRRGALVAAIAAFCALYGGLQLRQRRALDARVRVQLAEATRLAGLAHAARTAYATARGEAFALFDAAKRAEAERSWARALVARSSVERAFREASEAFEKALVLGQDTPGVRLAFADFLLERAELADAEHQVDARDELLQRLRLHDPDGSRLRSFYAPAHLALSSQPAGASVEMARVDVDPRGRRSPGTPRPVGKTPLTLADLEPGAWQVTLRAEGRAETVLPIWIGRGQRRSVSVNLPRQQSVPAGFAYVPAGRGWFGTASGEGVRGFFNTAPLHEVETPAFLISRQETTYADWIEYLRALPPDERARRRPHVGTEEFVGQLELQEVSGVFQLRLQPVSSTHLVREGEPLVYAGRAQRRQQDWRRLPVAGISLQDGRAYAAWLDRTRRVPGARLCAEREWERAARGADTREYPHGDVLEPEEADFDLSYGKVPAAFGPDAVGSHPESRSPFGVDDMAGNVWEWTESSLGDSEGVARGGSYYSAMDTCRTVNRELPGPDFRSPIVGVRICATAPP
jgi:formylglycine-generating enzyme required for sulfatase activity